MPLGHVYLIERQFELLISCLGRLIEFRWLTQSPPDPRTHSKQSNAEAAVSSSGRLTSSQELGSLFLIKFKRKGIRAGTGWGWRAAAQGVVGAQKRVVIFFLCIREAQS